MADPFDPWTGARAASAQAVPASGVPRVDGLLSGLSWADRPGGAVVLSYSFPASAAVYPRAYSAAGEPDNGFAALSATQREAVRTALGLWSEVADIRFVEVQEGGAEPVMRFAATRAARTAQAYFPDDDAAAGDVWLGRGFPTDDGYEPGSYELLVLVHEIGHALGLKHPHDQELIRTLLGREDDQLGLTVMSYRAYAGAPLDRPFLGDDFPSTPMLLDIAAIQYLYGANEATAAGDTSYAFAAGERIWRTLYDVGGTDTIDLSDLAKGVRLDLRPGALSEVGPPADTGGPAQRKTLAIAEGTLIENAIGTEAADRILGNNAANRLEGRSGNDTLEGGAGDDLLVPGAGDDKVVGGAGLDRVVLDGALADFALRIKKQKVDLTDLLGEDGDQGRDRLQSVELLVFDDQVVSTGASGAQALAALLAQPEPA